MSESYWPVRAAMLVVMAVSFAGGSVATHLGMVWFGC